MRLINNLQEEKIKSRKAAKLSAQNSPDTSKMQGYLLSDNKTMVYFPLDKPLDKLAERLAVYERKITCVTTLMEDRYSMDKVVKIPVV